MSKDNIEKEAVYLALIPKRDAVRRLATSCVDLLQLVTFYEDGTLYRLRRTQTLVNGVTIESTFKTKPIGYGAKTGVVCHEYNNPATQEFFDGFRKHVKHQTTDKTRCTHRIGRLNYEVDIFRNSSGTELDWCKIDIEVPSSTVLDLELIEQSFQKLPFQIDRWLSLQNPAHRAEIDKIWKTTSY